MFSTGVQWNHKVCWASLSTSEILFISRELVLIRHDKFRIN